MNNQIESNSKKYYARRMVMFTIIMSGVAAFVFFMMAMTMPNFSGDMVGIFILAFVINIFQYNMVYIEIGNDFISLKPAVVRGVTTVLFDEVESVNYQPKKVVIIYKNAQSGKINNLIIRLNPIENEPRAELLSTLKIIFANKEKV